MSMNARNKKRAIIGCCCVVIVAGGYSGFVGIRSMLARPARRPYLPSHAEIAGKPLLKAEAKKLKRTIVAAHLEQAMEGDKNVLWCATFQICWNELCDFFGGEIHMAKEPPMVASLNRRLVDVNSLDPNSYIAAVGIHGEGIFPKIEQMLQEKFGGQASPEVPEILRRNVLPGFWVTYSYLFKELPFEYKFARLQRALEFGKDRDEVVSFGINLLSPSRGARAGHQIRIYDYRNSSDFVVEILTKSASDRLILAKIPPDRDLLQTIANVTERLKANEPEEMMTGTSLRIPILNFDIMREYSELYHQALIIGDSGPEKPGFVIAVQRNRFRLDERGAVLISEGGGGGGGALEPPPEPRHLIFDKPFLIMIQRVGAGMPYFALWVANAELLVAFE